jgi:hypothetical protein
MPGGIGGWFVSSSLIIWPPLLPHGGISPSSRSV